MKGEVKTRHKKLPFQAILDYNCGKHGDKIKKVLYWTYKNIFYTN
jgi:hypothetical protein